MMKKITSRSSQSQFILHTATAYCILLLLTANCLLASPAEPTPIRKTQPDGTEITIIQRGDEKVHWMETLDGYTLLYDAEQYVVYATTDAHSNLVPSSVRYRGNRAGAQAPAVNGTTPLQKGLRYSPAQVAVLQQLWEVADVTLRQQQAAPAPVLGVKKALCVLMEYPDLPMIKTKQDFDNLLNQAGYSKDGAIGSVRDFYHENSYGKMTLNITVAGPYKAAHSHSAYGDRSGSYAGADLAREAITAAHNDNIDLHQFAGDNNQLETFHVIFAGHGSEASGSPADIWSHKWQLSSPLTLGGVTAHVYSCSPELRKASGSDITHIGVICHELCHVFGAPDYYDSDGGAGGNFDGTGNWDLMANGMWNGPTEAAWGTVPAHINMFQKIQYGWVTPVELTGSQNVTDMPNSVSNPVAYVINVGNNGEQYVLENRQRTGFDTQVPGHGLLIYHAHPSLTDDTDNKVNARHPQLLYPVCASASIAKPNNDPRSYGSINNGGCPFPGTTGKPYFTDATIPMSFAWTTGEGIQSPITDIKETNGKISFGFKQKSIPDYALSLNHGDVTTSKQTARLTFTVTGNAAPLSYKVSEEESRLNNVSWQTYSPSVTYTFETNNAGYKSVYTKLKNEIGETGVKSAVIYFKPIEKSDISTAQQAQQTQQEWVKIYPTAVETNLTVERELDASPVNMTVFSTTGMPYLTKKLTAPTETLNLSNCPTGILLIHISDGKKQTVLRALKL